MAEKDLDEMELDPGDVKTRVDLIDFIDHLRVDFNENKEEWENCDIDSFLEAMSAWLNDMGDRVESHDKYALVAIALAAASIYE